jgi:hypothetical protein
MRQHDHVEPSDQPNPDPDESTCPWCPYTGRLKQVLRHMESAHPKQWRDVALYPPIAGAPAETS